MQASSYMLAHELANSVGFNDLLDDLIRDQKDLRIANMRSAVKGGDSVKASVIEGEIEFLEELPRLFRYYGQKYKPS